jgi:hypothetical protein
VQVFLARQDKIIDLLGNTQTMSDFKLDRVTEIMGLLKHSLRSRKHLGPRQVKDSSHFCIRLVLMSGEELLSVGDFVELAGSDFAGKDPSIMKTFSALKNTLTHQGNSWEESALTMELRASLDIYHQSSPSQVLMIVTVAQDQDSKVQSLAALKFASRIKACVGREQANQQRLFIKEFEVLQKEILNTSRCPTPDASHWVDTRERMLNRIQDQLPSSFKDDCCSLRDRLHAMQTNWITERQKYADHEEVRASREDQQNKVNELEEALTQSQMAVEELEAERAQLDESVKARDAEIVGLKRRNDDMCKAQSRQEALIAKLKADLNETQGEHQSLSCKVSDLQTMVAGYKERLAEAAGRTEVYEEKLRSLKRELDGLKAQLASADECGMQLERAKEMAASRSSQAAVLESRLANETARAAEAIEAKRSLESRLAHETARAAEAIEAQRVCESRLAHETRATAHEAARAAEATEAIRVLESRLTHETARAVEAIEAKRSLESRLAHEAARADEAIEAQRGLESTLTHETARATEATEAQRGLESRLAHETARVSEAIEAKRSLESRLAHETARAAEASEAQRKECIKWQEERLQLQTRQAQLEAELRASTQACDASRRASALAQLKHEQIQPQCDRISTSLARLLDLFQQRTHLSEGLREFMEVSED